MVFGSAYFLMKVVNIVHLQRYELSLNNENMLRRIRLNG